MRTFLTALLCLVLVTAPGCANIQNDATRTTTEGGLTGAAVGAGLESATAKASAGPDTAARKAELQRLKKEAARLENDIKMLSEE